MESAIRRHQH